MQTNEYISFKRTWYESRKNFIINKSGFITFVGGITVGLFLNFLITWVLTNRHRAFEHQDYTNIFFVFLAISGYIFIGTSFSAFRSKENSMSYLLNPSSHFEKFFIEWVVRVILFLTIYPFYFWAIARISHFVLNPIAVTEIELFYFAKAKLTPFYFDNSWDRWAFISLFVNIASIILLGAASFKKLSMVLTPLAVGTLVGFFFLIGCLLSYIYYPEKMNGLEWELRSEKLNNGLYLPQLITYLVGYITPFFLWTMTYLKIKEKEV